MDVGSLVLQNLFSICSSVIAAVVGFLLLRIMRGVRASTDRTEEHAKNTEKKVSQLDLDKVSLTASNRELEQWQRDMALRIEAAADSTSDSLAWQANRDREAAQILRELEHMRARMAAVEKFARDLDAYAHGHTGTPTYTPPATGPTSTTYTTEEPLEQLH